MAWSDAYRQQVALLMRILPFVAEQDCFALKGGTAINLFVRDMPRLSVDIDLTYLPVHSRSDSLAAIDAALKQIEKAITKAIPEARINYAGSENAVTKLIVRASGVQVKIEVTPVSRGTVFDPEVRDVSQAVEDTFGFASIQVVSFADLYAGKLVAALDRQHPRDLFDVRDLLANEGITDDLRDAFIVYLLGHNRPMFEVLSVRRKDIAEEFKRGFEGMTTEPVVLDELLAAREALVADIVDNMPDKHRRFLISFEKGAPDWPLLGIERVSFLPAVLWRQQNLDGLKPAQREELVAQLEKVLDQSGKTGAQV